MSFVYQTKNDKQLRNKFYSIKGVRSFVDFKDFKNWYDIQEKICHYCGIKEEEIQKVVKTGKLNSNRFPLDGQISQGRTRGVWLEIDRKNPKDPYSHDNCVLACYFCNNDKSDVFNDEQYKAFFQERASFLRNLLHSS